MRRPNISFGKLTRLLVDKCATTWGDSYPAWPWYADECERLLSFIDARRQLERFWPRLCSRPQQRDEALNEIRVAHFLDRCGYPVIGWEVTDAPPYNVEFEVSLGHGPNALVEVKSPGWEAELSEQELKEGRAKQEKYVGIEGRFSDPIGVIRRTVKKALPKFTGMAPSLIVISDDCRVPLVDWAWGPPMMALTQRSIAYGDGLFHNPDYATIGGVCLFWLSEAGVDYATICIANPNAMASAALPEDMLARICAVPEPPPQIIEDENFPWF